MISSVTQRVLSHHFVPLYSVSRVVPNANEKRRAYWANTPDIEKFARKEYKKYPYNISHYDPESDQYIASERDDYKKRIEVDSYNHIIDQLKNDLAMQKQVDEALQKLDRPYLSGKPGLTKNITGGLRDYFPSEVPDIQDHGYENDDLAANYMFRNEKRWIGQTVFYYNYPTPSNIKNWMKERDARPVNSHFHHDKGSKYDVELAYENRYPYLADRLGHPEFIANPLQRLLRLEGDLYHPVFTDQPFVQKPNPEPSETLNFEEGEVLYENTRLIEWCKLWSYGAWLGYLWAAVIVPLNLLYKTNLPTDAQLENNFYPYFMHSIYNIDYLKIHVFGLGGIIGYGTLHFIAGLKGRFQPYVTRVQYSKDKELVFVQRVSAFGGIVENVYETHHLEIVPNYSPSTTVHQMHNDGMYEVQSLNEHMKMFMYREDHFWNPKLKKQFLLNHTQLITRQHYGMKRLEEQEYLAEQKQAQLPTSAPEAA